MTVLDAYAVLAYFRAENAADEVAELLRKPTILSAVNAAEVIDQLVRVFGYDGDDVHADLALLAKSGLMIEAVVPDIGLQAGRLRARHYHRERMPVSMADCVAAATALSHRLPLATSDPALARLVRAEGGQVHGLPDSDGRRP
ncbi:PIN domain-containing protein [Mycobacterium hubeiense]|uniref:PIN domain-containing protein n=1 Tax=Mycobacterium hubeiense TaxID=1867256 RepID=UPI001304292F|nr:PIN domain-containing protein [Mycobacterium sp. QGD 101]